MQAQTQQPIAAIETKPQVTHEDLLDVITELKTIIKEAISAIS